MSNKVEKTAKRFIKEVKGKIDVFSIVEFASNIGYKVVFFNTVDGDKLVNFYELEYAVKVTPALTVSGEDNLILVDGAKHAHDQIYLLLHEIGHILLGHIGDGKISLKDKPFLEAEANAFVYEVMNPHKRHIALTLAILCVTVAIGFFGGIIARGVMPENTDNVFITKSGGAFHKEGCMTIKGKDYISIPRSEAEKLFDPCGVCNP